MKTTVTAVLEGLQARLTTISVRTTGEAKSRPAELQVRGWRSGDESVKRIEQALAGCGIETGPEILEARADDAAAFTADSELAVAIAVAMETGRVSEERTAKTVFAGRVGADGTIEPVRGMVPIAHAAVRKDMRLAGPIRQTTEVAHSGPVTAVLREELGELIDALNDPTAEEVLAPPAGTDQDTAESLARMPFGDQEKERLALAAAGHHHVQLNDSVLDLVMCLPGLMGPPTAREQEQIAIIHSVAGLGVPADRPLRYPHYTTPAARMTGWNGDRPRAPKRPAIPGEISLAHNGVLAIELGHPWAEGAIEHVIEAVKRGYASDGMPSQILIAGIGTECSESAAGLQGVLEIDGRRKKREKTNPDPAGSSARLVQQVREAQAAQDQRYGEGRRNGTEPANNVKERSELTPAAEAALDKHAGGQDDAALRLTRIARTLADMKGNSTIVAGRVNEAAKAALPAAAEGEGR